MPRGRWTGCCADHPHGRGENQCLHRSVLRSAGPSPRAWGELRGPGRRREERRTIPTGVGRTPGARARAIARADHPHGRGENNCINATARWMCGPSPRAWGEPGVCPRRARGGRTIPTGVGRTCSWTFSAGCRADHPHGRGENYFWYARTLDFRGPSPRAWGERSKNAEALSESRTIPTGVGRTCKRLAGCHRWPDHPHGRGENTPDR